MKHRYVVYTESVGLHLWHVATLPVLIILGPDGLVEVVIRRLQVLLGSNCGQHQAWVSIHITRPRLINQLISENVVIFFEVVGNNAPGSAHAIQQT